MFCTVNQLMYLHVPLSLLGDGYVFRLFTPSILVSQLVTLQLSCSSVYRPVGELSTPLIVINWNAARYRSKIIQAYDIPFVQGQQHHMTFHKDASPGWQGIYQRSRTSMWGVAGIPKTYLAPIEHV